MGNTISQLFPPTPTFTEKNLPDQAGKVFIVTGASSGIGKELAYILYLRNAKVYVATRSEEKAFKAIADIKSRVPSSQGSIHFLHLDLDDLTTIKNTADAFLRDNDRLDVLWNNAGVAVPPQGSKTKQGYELQLGTNNVAPFLFTQFLLPILAKTAKVAPADSVRVVWVSSNMAEISAPKGGIDFDNLDYKTDKIVPWGRLGHPLREDLVLAQRSEKEGGTGQAEKFWEWSEEQVKNHMYRTNLYMLRSRLFLTLLNIPQFYEPVFRLLTPFGLRVAILVYLAVILQIVFTLPYPAAATFDFSQRDNTKITVPKDSTWRASGIWHEQTLGCERITCLAGHLKISTVINVFGSSSTALVGNTSLAFRTGQRVQLSRDATLPEELVVVLAADERLYRNICSAVQDAERYPRLRTAPLWIKLLFVAFLWSPMISSWMLAWLLWVQIQAMNHAHGYHVGQEIIDVLVAAKKHEILLLSRKDVPAGLATQDVTWVKVNYQDPKQLAQTLRKVHTVLSFISTNEDPASTIQKNLIDAAIQAGVKRFAPSEWSTSGLEHMSWYAYKAETRRYLKELNKNKTILEYTLFQPGLFLNYFTSPYKSSKHLDEMELPFDFNKRRALVLDGGNEDRITLTTVQDCANVVARAIDYEGKWPVVSGIRGADMSIGQLIALGEKIRDAPFEIEKLKANELESGAWKSSWIPKLDHPSIPPEQVAMFSKIIVAGVLLAISAKDYSCTDEWNQLLPDYKFTQPEEFLSEAWRVSLRNVLVKRSLCWTMAGASPQVEEPGSRRRKIRKGTQSCWECRRRKVRCIFAATTDAICENCRRRRTACNSQEHTDEPIRSAGSNQVEVRLGRVEELIEHLINSAGTAHNLNSPPQDLWEDHLTHLEPRALISSTSESTLPRPPLKLPSPATTTSQVQSRRAAGKYEELSHTLIMAWPSQHDIDLICTLPVGLSAHLHSGLCTPYSSSMHWDPPSPREMLQLPPSGSHPVLIARKLLVLGTFLQGIHPSYIENLADRGAVFRDIMSRVVDTAIRLVTTNEDLINSVEGIECIMIESMYQNYAGNLHRAWMAVRRATTVAEMMALHRGLHSPSLKILELETRRAFNPDQICFRLVEMDAYLSLMLGLPRTSLEARFATPKALEGCQPIDRMQRIHCAMADRILQGNEKDLSETHSVDTLLQKAAAEMPPQWWLIPDLSTSSSGGGIEVLHETVRLMDQFTHYHLLIRLHLPYMLRSSPHRTCDHSKITAVNASREILNRYAAFRISNPAHFYCRGTDFLAFIAATVLCLAHIDSRGRCHSPPQTSNPSTAFNFLAHSRPSDRGIMECTLDIIESMARAGTDAIASKIARILRPLLAIEAEAASGTGYSTDSSKGDEEELEFHGKLTNGGKGLHIYIPFFGTIDFECRAISKTVPEQGLATTSVADILLPDNLGQHNEQASAGSDRPLASQIGSQLDYHNTQPGQSQFGHLQLPFSGNGVSSSGDGNMQESQLPVCGDLPGSEDDWDLQGVDVALFDSLFHGFAIPDAVEEEAWAEWASNG
ncbi:hypothetical protein P7C71_g1220, partial [Lecanoromycetidae sp. Uapishka_2]